MIITVLPSYDEICKRSARFIAACLCSDKNLVQSVVNYGILARCHSVVGRNGMFLTRRYAWSLDQLVSGQLLLRNADFMARYLSTVTSDELGLHTSQWNCCAYVNTHGNLVTIVPTACLF